MGSVDSISKLPVGEISTEIKNKISPSSAESHTNTLEQQPTTKEINEKELNKVVKDMNMVLKGSHTSLKYVYHEKLQTYYVTLVNDQTNETVREIPSKKLLDMYASMKDYLGLFVDNKI